MPTMNTIVEAVREAQSDTQKTASSNEGMSKEAELLDGVIDNESLEKMAEDEISKAAKYAKKGREMLKEEVQKIAEKRKQIADEYGEEKLAELDRASTAQEYGRKIAQNEAQSQLEKNAYPGGQMLSDAAGAVKNHVGEGAGQIADYAGQGVNYADRALRRLGYGARQAVGPQRADDALRSLGVQNPQALNRAAGGAAVGTGAAGTAGTAGAAYGANQLAKESSFEKLADEHGEDTARDMMKASHFDQAGRELAHMAAQSELEKNAGISRQFGKAQDALSQYLGQPAMAGLRQAGNQVENLGQGINRKMLGTGKQGLQNLRAVKNRLGIENTDNLERLVGGTAVGGGTLGLGGAAYGANQLA